MKAFRKLAASFVALTLFSATVAQAQGPEGAPGVPHSWAPALKQAVGTAYESQGAKSPVWFTVAAGVLTEVFYPTIDQAQIGDLQFLVSDGQSFFSEQKRNTTSLVTYSGEGMSVEIRGNDHTGAYSFTQQILTDTDSPTVRVRTSIRWQKPSQKYKVYVLFKPAIQNTGSQNLGSANDQGLFASKHESFRGYSKSNPIHAALTSSLPWAATSAGYVGFSDGWQDVSRNFRMTKSYREAGPGNVALIGELPVPAGREFTYELALSFGSSRQEALALSRAALTVPFRKALSDYENGWAKYLNELENSSLGGSRFMRTSSQARRSAQLIKMHEDKKHRGALIASLSKPAIPDGANAMDGSGGYHLVWPRDLYHSAMGLLAAGDTRTPVDVLRYLQQTQLNDGSWSQNFWIDGKPYWRGLQLDEVAFPILLAAQLKDRGVLRMKSNDLEMVRKAAQFIATHGPTTPQDRWEEIGGYVPSTLASEIAALKKASALTGDSQFANLAAQWDSQFENWTFANEGPLGKNYYLRTSPHGNPNGTEPIHLANGAGSAYANEILDGGFLELVRLGLREASDPAILSTMALYENPKMGIMTGNPATGTTYRRYNRDQYGPHHVGGYWPLLAGERGHYSVSAGDLKRASSQLQVLESSALPSGVIPEQTVDSGSLAGLGVACPLVWAHAEDILLHRSIEEGEVFDAPRTRR